MNKKEFDKSLKKFELKRKQTITYEDEVIINKMLTDYLEDKINLTDKQLDRLLKAKDKTIFKDRGSSNVYGS